MGEIRSTLDIIMEKTEGLTMTEEEKKELQRRELAGKARGIIQKYVDGIIDLERVNVEMASAGKGNEGLFRRAVIEGSMGYLAPGQDNEAILQVLENTAGIDTQSMRRVLVAFQDRMDEEKNTRENTLRTELNEKGIWGSSVIPNLEADSEWKDYFIDTRKEFLKKLKEGLQQFLSG